MCLRKTYGYFITHKDNDFIWTDILVQNSSMFSKMETS